MKFYDDTRAARPLIEETIRKFGYAPEHHVDWYEDCADAESRNVFVLGDHGDGLLTSVERASTHVFSSPIASEPRRAAILVEYAEEMFRSSDIKKIWLELETPVRKELLKALPESCKANSIAYTLTWPIMDLRAFDPALPGGHYKYLRKAKHRFYRSHAVAVVDAKTFDDRQGLHRIVDEWRRKRKAHDRAWFTRYHRIIDNGFAGTTEARVFMVDGVPAGFNAGWMIPNSDRYYGAVGIHDYLTSDVGLMLYLEDLEWLKARGYGEADMAGGEKALTAFKDEFLPASYYKTHVFSVVRR